ncbi:MULTISPECIES: hypothetical protein [Actinomadura]|uniref:MFS transporter n=1 Tax=Actinomadura yumaensis TaxID=111807 RepID=A0ABW2CLH8_9ACTN|nr:hypothetical protein [Actinomadura sp. J1-007]MWK40316.1 hypothetical protein [Actinomadura sp. J1-007]
MTGPGATLPRCARGAFLAAVCTLLSLGGHVLGGAGDCCVPPWQAVAVTGAVVGALCVALARRMMSFRRILAVVGWAQVAFHFSFTVAAPGPGHHMGAPAPGAAGGVAGPFAMGPSMLAGHALAAVAAAVLLAGAERALWWLCGAVFAVAFARLLTRPAPVRRAPWTVVVQDDPAPRLGVVLARSVRRRGPPAAPSHAVA